MASVLQIDIIGIASNVELMKEIIIVKLFSTLPDVKNVDSTMQKYMFIQ